MSQELEYLKNKLWIPEEVREQEEAVDTEKRKKRTQAMMSLAAWGAASGSLGVINREFARIDRAAAAAEKDELYHRIGEANFKQCRKRCPDFKCKRCWEKSFQEQRECWERRKNNAQERTV